MLILAPALRQIVRTGTLEVIDSGGKLHTFGDGQPPRARIRIHDAALPWKILLTPSLGIGEGYMDGRLTMERGSLYDFLYILTDNIRGSGSPLPMHRLFNLVGKCFRRIQQFNPATRAKHNVAHHYDLKPELFELFLDEDRQYSCAYFDSLDDSIDTAQENKKRHLAAKLLLGPGQRVLDIGCGWGGLGLYIARRFDAHVTGITLSEEQHVAANQRARAERLAGRATFDLRDYRAQTGKFERIVSVGMFEHVGVPHFDAFFGKIKELLTDDGVALLHTIGRSEPPDVADPWYRKYIFPGGYLPALSEIMASIERTGLMVSDIEFIGPHYAETCKHWRLRFLARREEAKAIYDERFCLMWEFYLATAELLFRTMGKTVFQIQLVKNRDAVPLTRDYIYEAERALAQRSGPSRLSA
jgi:cyclopropane-fatty-acyl-phospholipid synthase